METQLAQNEASWSNTIPGRTRAPKIRKVESRISLVDKHVYRPCQVAIGPCNSSIGKDMIEEKQKCLKKLLDLLSCPDQMKWQQDMACELEQIMTEKANGFYAALDLNDVSEDSFNMRVLDGSYILDHFLEMEKIMSGDVDEPGSNPDWQAFLCSATDTDVVRDVLYVFENQIPFVVLETLYLRLVSEEKEKKLPLRRLMVEWVREELKYRKFIYPSQQAQQESWYEETPPWEHLLELVHRIITGSGPPGLLEDKCCNDGGTTKWRRASFYDGAAVSFVRRPLDGIGTYSILDVNLDWWGSTLHIPPLTIDRDTLTMLLNLMVLEMYDENIAQGKKHVTSYCFFLSRIAREARDVELLSKNLILENELPNDDIAANKISRITWGFYANHANYNYLHKTAQALDSRFDSRIIIQSIRWLKKAMVAMSIGGLVIFVCTILQALYSILAYYKR